MAPKQLAGILDRYAGHHAQKLVTAEPNDDIIYGDRVSGSATSNSNDD
jgi:hypothetical protein